MAELHGDKKNWGAHPNYGRTNWDGSSKVVQGAMNGAGDSQRLLVNWERRFFDSEFPHQVGAYQL